MTTLRSEGVAVLDPAELLEAARLMSHQDPDYRDRCITVGELGRIIARLVQQEHRVEEDGACWCQPRIEDVQPDGQIVIHKEAKT